MEAPPAEKNVGGPVATDSGATPLITACTPTTARCMVVEVDDIARVIPMHGSSCGLCDAVTVAETSARDRFFIDGRLVCEKCRLLFEPNGFTPRYNVCSNPMCRRKWKQLTPKSLINFCPPCRRHLEEGVPNRNSLQEVELLEQMWLRWRDISNEIAALLSIPTEVPLANATTPAPIGTPSQKHATARVRWSELLTLFRAAFRQPPKPEMVRNWNSVHGRRKHYRGVLRRIPENRFICTLEAGVEMSGDKTYKPLKPGQREFHVIDWFESFEEGQEMFFVAFPNPSVEERDLVHRVVRLLNETDEKDAVCVTCVQDCATVAVDAGTPKLVLKPLRPTSRRSSPALPSPKLADASFADLMQWSQDQLEDDPAGEANPRSESGSRKKAVITNSPAVPTALPAGPRSPDAAYFGD